MSIREKMLHSFIISVIFSFINWMIIDKFIIPLTLGKYIFIEIILVISIKLFTFVKLKLKLN